MWEGKGGKKPNCVQENTPQITTPLLSWVLPPPSPVVWAISRVSGCPRSPQGWEGRPNRCDGDGIAVPKWKMSFCCTRGWHMFPWQGSPQTFSA